MGDRGFFRLKSLVTLRIFSAWIFVGILSSLAWGVPRPLLTSDGTFWKDTPPPSEMNQILQLYRSPHRPDGNQATFSVRIDESASEFSGLDAYSKKWAKELPRFGYEILSSGPFEMAGEKGFVFDVLHRASKKQARQVLFFRKTGSAVLTCMDQIPVFSDTGRECDKLIKTFRWSEPASDTH